MSIFFATPWTVTCQASLSMGYSRQEYWSELSFPSPGDLILIDSNSSGGCDLYVKVTTLGSFFIFLLYGESYLIFYLDI